MNFQQLLPDLEPALRSLATSELVMAIKSSSWAMPSILCVHVLAIAVLGGATLLPGLRLMGVGMTSVAPSTIEKTVRPWLWGALIVLAISGGLMAFVNPMKLYRAPAFLVKVTALIPALILSFGVIRSIASRDGVVTQQTKILAAVAAVLWLAAALIFGTSYGAAPGSFHVVTAGWLIVMAFGANLTRIVLGAITAVVVIWMVMSTMVLQTPLDNYDVVMEIDRWTLRFMAVVVAGLMVWDFTRARESEFATPRLNRLIGVLTILAWFTVAAGGRWIGLGGGGS